MASKIMLIRHGEKPSGDGKIHGVDKNGCGDADELSVQGWQRAGALIRLFAPLTNVFTNPALATPDSIYACAPAGHATSVRSKHTVQPLAKTLNQAVNLTFNKGEEKKLAKAAAAGTQGTTLIAWEHDRILDIAAGVLGDDALIPHKWPDSRFDLVWVLDRQTDASWRFTQVAQMVLPCDQPEVIGEHLAAGG